MYLGVDEDTLDNLVALPADQRSGALERLEESSTRVLHLDKAWDGLHFLLTGVSAGSPIEGAPLSEAVVGVHVFDGDDYVGCSELDELPAILAELERVPLAGLLADADFSAFARAGIYPNTWGSDPAVLTAELTTAFAELLDFHRGCLTAGEHLVVSIL